MNSLNKEEYIVEIMTPSDAPGVTNCMLRTYGRNYPTHEVYEPRRIAHLNKTGEMVSVVAKTKDGEVVGHYCIIIENVESRLGELGQAAVDPLHRKRGLMKRMRVLLEKKASSMGLAGLYSAPVTTHTYSQRVNYEFGSRECCIDLGYVPPGLTFTNIPGEDKYPQRETIIVFFKHLKDDNIHKVYLPEDHYKIIEKIYSNLKTDRVFISEAEGSLSENTDFNYRISPKWACSWIGIFKYGKDSKDVFKRTVEEILSKEIDTIHLDLPLNDLLTPSYCKFFESLGFFFIGVIPNFLRGTDALRLQYIVSQKIDFSRINLYSDFAGKLFDYIKSEYEKAESNKTVSLEKALEEKAGV
ncbi:MAG: GNAT family N-acetyltransferase [Armatimonadota bacterium]